MGVTIELQNLGDAQLCRDITAHPEHAFSGRQGEWRVSIAGSRSTESWDLRVEGPNGFERSYALSADAGEHEPAAIRALVLKLRAACHGVTTPFVGPGAAFLSFR
jgi:hypothetical protein